MWPGVTLLLRRTAECKVGGPSAQGGTPTHFETVPGAAPAARGVPGGYPRARLYACRAGFGNALYSIVLVSGRPLRVDVRTCQNSSIFSILQCFTPVALVSHNSAQPGTSFVHFDP